MKTDMKKMIKMLTLAGIMFLSTSSIAASGELVVMEVTGTTTFKLIVNDITNSLTIKLIDQNGYVLHQEQANETQGYAKLYNVGDLPNGNYLMELDYGTKIRTYPLTIIGGHVQAQSSPSKEYFKPVLRQKDHLLALSHLSIDNTPLSMIIYDKNNELVFKDQLKGTISRGRQYDISSLTPGEYQVYLTCAGRNYVHTVQL